MITERPAVQRGKEIVVLRWDPGEPFNNIFFSNGGGRKKLADQVREWEFKVQSLNQAKLRIAEMHERARQEGTAKQIEDFCKRYGVTQDEFFAMSALSQEDRSDLIQILASGQASNYQQALEQLVNLRQTQEGEVDEKIYQWRKQINYSPQGGQELGESVAEEYRALHPSHGKTREYVLELYDNWKRWKNWQAEDDSSFDRFQSEWSLAQQGKLQEHVTNPFPFP